jgi:hypothetical protein
MERERIKNRPLKGGETYRSKPEAKYKKKSTWKKFYSKNKVK